MANRESRNLNKLLRYLQTKMLRLFLKKNPQPIRTFGTLLLVALLASSAQGQSTVPQQQELGAVQQELQNSTRAQEKLKQDVAVALHEQETISAQLIALARTIQSQESAVTSSEAKLLHFKKEAILIQADLSARQDQLSSLLAGLQRLQENPPPPLVVEPDDVLSALRGAMLLGSLVPELGAKAQELKQQLERLEQIQANTLQEKNTMTASLAALNQSQAELNTLISRKKQLVSENQTKLSEENKRSAALAAKAKSIQQLLATLEAERARLEAEKTQRMLAEDAERKAQEEALARPQMDFTTAQGKLEYPLQGQIIKRFGDEDGLGGKLRGLAIAARPKAQIVSPVDGKVEFAGPFRSYGQLLILNPGHDYLVLLAGMSQISADTGERVRAGEPVGVMGDGPSSVTLLGDEIQEQRPILYVEFRKTGEAIDSASWWIGGLKEANK